MPSIFDCCNICDALLTAEELEADEGLCACCKAEVEAAQVRGASQA